LSEKELEIKNLEAEINELEVKVEEPDDEV